MTYNVKIKRIEPSSRWPKGKSLRPRVCSFMVLGSSLVIANMIAIGGLHGH
jgi:hypothetical protein